MTADGKTFSRQIPPAAELAIIIAAVITVYSGVFYHPFQFDDLSMIVDNKDIRNLADIGAIWRRNPARFLTFLSLAANYHFNGLDTFGYHFFNIAAHAANAMLVYWLASMTAPAAWRTFPLMSALLFAVHPIQTQAVTYIWQRNTSLAAFFYLLSMALYLKSAKGVRAGGWFLALSAASAVAAMFTKQFAITLPIAIVWLDLCFVSGSFTALKGRAGRLAALLPAFLVIPLLTALGMNEEVAHIGARFYNMTTPAEYLLTQFNVITMYLRLMVWPAGQNLDYDIAIARSIADCRPSLLFLAALLCWAFLMFKRNRIVCFGVGFMFIALAVESSFYPLEDLAFEHRMYLPSAGVFMTFSALVHSFASPPAGRTGGYMLNIPLAVTLALAVALSSATMERNRVWGSAETLWRDVTEKSPDKPRGYINLASELLRNGKINESEAVTKKALELAPDNAAARLNLGLTAQRRHMPAAALREFKEAARLDPLYAPAHFLAAQLLFRAGDLNQAGFHYATAINIEPSNIAAHVNLGATLINLGRPDDAIRVLNGALAIDPQNTIALRNMGIAYGLKGDKANQTAFRLKAEAAERKGR